MVTANLWDSPYLLLQIQITDPSILVPVIVGIVGPVLTHCIKYILEQRKYYSFPKERRVKLLAPVWEGHFEQDDPSDHSKKLKVGFRMELSRKGKKVIGDGTIDAHPNHKLASRELVLDHGMFDGKTLKIEYANKDRGIFHKGSMILDLNDFGNELKGHFVGYSPSFKKIIPGEVFLKSD